MAQFNFDATQHNPESSLGQLSVGRHLVIIEKDEIKKAKDTNGGYLELSLKGVGQSQAESGAYRLNLFAAGENAQKTISIASSQLSAICYAVGVLGINGDTSVLWNLPFMVEVAYQKGHNPATDGSDAKGYTEVKRVLTANGEEIKAGMQPGGSGAQQQQQSGFGQQQPQGQAAGAAQFGQQQPQQQPQQQQANFGQPQQQQQQQPQQQGGWQPNQGQQQQQQWQPRQG